MNLTSGLCNNCAYSIGNNPSICTECIICCRNSSYLEKTFSPTSYLGVQVKEPIDMYISREHYGLILKKIEQMNSDKVIKQWPWSDTNSYPGSAFWPIYTYTAFSTTKDIGTDSSYNFILSKETDMKVNDPKKRKLRGKN